MSSLQSDVGRNSKVITVGVVVAALAIIYVALTYFIDSDRSAKKSQISAVETRGQGTQTQESEHYSQVLDHYNRQKAASAEQSGDSYLSVLSSRSNNVSPQQTKPAPQQTAQPTQVYYQPTPQDSQRDAEMRKEVSQQVQGLMSNWAPVAHATARVSGDSVQYGYANSINNVVSNGSAQANSPAATKVVDDFTLVPALLETDIDTDENSMVTVSIPSGKYKGAQLYAMGYKRITNSVDMTFTYMSFNGRSYKVTAKAVDANSMRTALSGEVNNHYFSRIIVPAIAMGIARTGQLYEQASEQNIITDQGVIQTYPSTPSGRAVAGTILGGMGAQAGQVLANDAANMPVKQVVIPKGTTIGIQFIGPVLSSSDVAAEVASSTQSQQTTDPLNALSQPASQAPRQNLPPMQQFNGYQQGNNMQQYPNPGYGYSRY